MLNIIRDKNVLIVGGYYRANIDPIIESASEVTVFYNASDSYEPHHKYNTIGSTNLNEFATWTVTKLNIHEE